MTAKTTKENNSINKEIEKKFEITLNEKYLIVRLDGKGFSKFTKKFFQKPYDSNFDEIMQNITIELFKTFNASFAYTQSDEITLLFYGSENGSRFNGRIQKIISLLAGKASSLLILELIKKGYVKAAEFCPFFDARIFATNDFEEVEKNIEFRYFDCLRNSKLNLSMFLSKKDRLFKSGNEIIELTKDKLNYFELPLSYRKGTFIIKEEVEIKNVYIENETVNRKIIKKINIDNFPKGNFFEFFNLEKK